MLTVIFNYIKFFSIIIAASIAIEMRFLLPMLFMAVCTAVLSTQSEETGTCSPWNGMVRATGIKLIKYKKKYFSL